VTSTPARIEEPVAVSCGWTWEEHSLSEGYSCVVYDQHGRMIADHLSAEIARLIASAPDLLEALMEAQQLYLDGILNTPSEQIERVHQLRIAAIVRATGA
jgi:hypothetical protein